MSDLGHPVQLLKLNTDTKKFELDTKALHAILMDDAVVDCPLAVISIAGAYRQGKSFLLNFLVRYLNYHYTRNLQGDWLKETDSIAQSRFEFKGGSKCITTGILVWSKIFTTTLWTGQKVGVLLMDTQGTFDNETTMAGNVMIFALSTMLSSVQIFNIFHQLQEDHLHNLQLFAEYGKHALRTTLEKPFQKLLFLIRDWSNPWEFPYGAEGGQDRLDDFLATRDDQYTELSESRFQIKAYFETLSGFLMPEPGKAVKTSPNFSGSIKEIDDDFVEQLYVLADSLLIPENLVLKRTAGQLVTAKDLFHYAVAYADAFHSNIVPQPKSVFMVRIGYNI